MFSFLTQIVVLKCGVGLGGDRAKIGSSCIFCALIMRWLLLFFFKKKKEQTLSPATNGACRS